MIPSDTDSIPAFAPADIVWREDGTPFSPQYGDVYFSRAGGVAEKRAVFVEGCELPARFAEDRDAAVLELGFGTGLGFLVTAQAFLDAAPSGRSQLWFYSIEKHPWRRADFDRLRAFWPAFSGVAAELSAHWPDATPGFHRRYLAGGRIVLTLLFGEALSMLSALGAARFDAFYLDGFAPARNQAMWSNDLCAALFQRAAPGARVATYSAARVVADALRSAGFSVEKMPGFAGKRHRLLAAVPSQDSAESPGQSFARPESAVVLGAGIAGLSVAYALARRGVAVTVFDAGELGVGASGNPAGLLTPLLTVDHNLPSQLVQMGLGFSRAQILQLRAQSRAVQAEFSGAFQVVRDETYAARQQRLLARHPPDASLAIALSAADLSAKTGLSHSLPGWWYPGAGWVAPLSWLAALSAEPGITLRPDTRITALQWHAESRQWQGWDEHGALGFASSTLIVAAGAEVERLLPELATVIFPCRGQVNVHASVRARQPLPLMREGYLVDLPDGRRVYGASFKPRETDIRVRAEEAEENRRRVGEISPDLLKTFGDAAAETDAARVSLRATTRHRLPRVGAYTPEGAGALWLSVGHGSRGLTTAPLCAEHLAALIGDEPAVLPRALVQALAPTGSLGNV